MYRRAVSKAMLMDSEITLYHAMTGREVAGATLPCLGTAFKVPPTHIGRLLEVAFFSVHSSK
jgi:hypothetical protein